jgi:hypothetical protein
MAAQILVVKPRALTAPDKKTLREAGVVVVEASDPSSVRLLQPEGSVLGGDELLYAAMQAIAKEGYDCTRKHFVTTVARLIAQHVREPQP